MFSVVCIVLATVVIAAVDVTDPLAIQALYNRISFSGTTADTLTDVLRSAGVTQDWTQRNANQLAQASGLPLQTIYGLATNLVPYYGFGAPGPAPTPMAGAMPSAYYGGVPSSYQDSSVSYRTGLQQILDRVRLYGTTKDSFAKLLRASNLDLNLLKTNFADFVFASGLDWKDVQDVYMTLKLGDACSPNPCPTGVCIPTGSSCPGCMPYSCLNVATPTFSEITPTRDPAVLKQMLRNSPGDPRLLAQYIPTIAAKAGMDISVVTSVVTDVIANTQAAAASLGAFGLPSLSPKDTILQVAAVVTTPAALFDALQRVLTSLQGSVDPSPFGALVPEIASASHLAQGQVAQVFGDLAKVARGTYTSPPSPPISPFGMFTPANVSPLPPTPMVATPDQLQALLARLGPGMDAAALKAVLTQSGINVPQLGTLLQQIAITTGLPTPTVSGILTQLLNAGQSPAPTAPTAPPTTFVPPTPATPLAVEYVISALTPGMSPASVEVALQRVKDPRTIAPFRSYITSRTQLSAQVVDSIVAKIGGASSGAQTASLVQATSTPILPPTPSLDALASAPPPPARPLAVSDKQLLDTLTPTTPQALFFTLKQVSDPTLLNSYIDQIANSTQVAAPTVQRVVAAVIQSAADSANLPPTPLSPPPAAYVPPTPGFPDSPPTDPPTSFNYPPTPGFYPPTPDPYQPTPGLYPPTPSLYPPTPAFNYPAPTPLPPAPSGASGGDPLAFIASLPADGTAQDVYQALQSSSIPPATLSTYVQQIAARTGVTAAIAQSILDTIAKLSSSGPSTAPSGSTDEFLAVATSLRDGMTIEEVRAILQQQVSDPRSLSVNIQSIAFRTGLEDTAVGTMIQDLIKSKQQSG